MCEPVSATIGAALITTAGTAIMGNQQRVAQERAMGQARADAEKQAAIAEKRANATAQAAKMPNQSDIGAALMPKRNRGIASTFLSGGTTTAPALSTPSLLGS